MPLWFFEKNYYYVHQIYGNIFSSFIDYKGYAVMHYKKREEFDPQIYQ